MIRVDMDCCGHRAAGRRTFLQVGAGIFGGLTLPSVLRARELAPPSASDTSVILLWLDGGPSHHDTYDPKPDAPREYAGIWNPIPTVVPGMDLCELLPLHAKIADRFSLIRSLHHNTGDHFTGGHWMLTGHGGVSGARKAARNPFFGSIATSVTGPRKPGMPAGVAIPYAMSIGLRPGYFGAGYLGIEHDPFQTGGNPAAKNFQVQNLNLASGLSAGRVHDRRRLQMRLDQLRRSFDAGPIATSMDRFEQQAVDLITGPRVREAFDIGREDDRTRDRYGRSTWGQSALLARRLVEAGSTFVTCHFGGWDTHWDHQGRMEQYLPRLDQTVYALITDLEERGLLEQTLVLVMGEFSRTPRMNDGGNGGPPLSKGTPGRDHWGHAMSVLLAGGGIRGGQIVGSTDRLGEVPQHRPLRPGDLHHTVFRVLGVDPQITLTDHSGRPVPAIDHGHVISELI